ncbi:hypothetical protein SASPL_130155 [Salvia splendens]|uniref:DUF7392 domain-containing protein n=1 Tax=Salvia splendens TaxID=180675 RepID=A0A8X8ZJN1_SALSN|nr:uncharacterized protein LOC121754146 [Salvia splendens]KAG6407171.1 hypothetical protein SASPL_130155 [Salvia splendens]
MACYVPFNSRNLDISFFILRPTIVCADSLIDALKQFSSYTDGLGCVHSSIFTSIHGSMIVWYGAWMKRSDENKQLLIAALISVLTNLVESMAILIDHSFFEAYAGESRDGSPAAKFFTGDVVAMSSAILSGECESNALSCAYAFLAIFKDQFLKMEGAAAGVCFKSKTMPKIVGLVVWKSLHSFYTYVLASDFRNRILPYFDGFAVDIKYDVFRVAYVSAQNGLDQPLQGGLQT